MDRYFYREIFVRISKVALSEDLADVEALVRSVSEQDVLPLFNELGKSEYLSRVLPDIKKTFDESCFYSVKLVSDQRTIGFAALRDGNYLTHLFVAKEAQGQGAGRLLLDHVLTQTLEKEISLRSSVNAKAFYLAYGFEVTGVESEFNGIRFVPMGLIRG